MGEREHHSAEQIAILLRLRRIEGQVRGLQRLVDSDRPCIDTLTQVAATTRALDSVALLLLDRHLRDRLGERAAADEEGDALAEASAVIRRLVRA